MLCTIGVVVISNVEDMQLNVSVEDMQLNQRIKAYTRKYDEWIITPAMMGSEHKMTDSKPHVLMFSMFYHC